MPTKVPNCFSLILMLVSLGFSLPDSTRAANTVLHLEIGDTARRESEVPLVLDGITDALSGELISPQELVARLPGRRIVFLGESHTDMDFHMAQLKVIEELHGAGRKVLIGLEMYPYVKQSFLDSWVAGEYTEEEFIEASGWFDSWGYHWNYYRDIFLFARKNSLPMYALNAPREVIAAVRKKGFDELTKEQAAHLPREINVESDEHFRLFKAFFDDEDSFHMQMSEEQWQGMFAAQCSWDATFAHNALRAIESQDDENALLVMLVGSGHVAYDLGIQRQLAQWSDLPTTSVIPIPIRDDEELIDQVQASFADFVWGVPAEVHPVYPSLGIAMRKRSDDERRMVLDVSDDSVAERAGFEVGDVLLAIDGQDLPDKESFNRLMAGKMWGDKATFEVLRGDQTVELAAAFRREKKEDDQEDEDRKAEEPEEPETTEENGK